MKILQKIFLLSFASLMFSSCKNDLKVNAPYKEMPSIYAVLNPYDKIQTIRINKVFLGEADASAMAQISDSVNYPAGELTVSLKRILNNAYVQASTDGQTEIIFRDSLITTDPGAFNQNQRIYVTNKQLFTWGDYVLTVTNNHTKNVFTARATVLDTVHANVVPFAGLPYPVPPGTTYDAQNFVDYSGATQNYKIRYNVNSAYIYQLVMRIHYYDSLLTDPFQNGYKHYDYSDYKFSNLYSNNASPTGVLTNTFKGQDVFNTVATDLANKGSYPTSIGKRTYKIQFFIYSSTKEYSDYLQFSAPSLSINQEKHLYSNFNDQAALGIFTFRSRSMIVKEMENSFITEFKNNSSTCPYHFFPANPSYGTGCN